MLIEGKVKEDSSISQMHSPKIGYRFSQKLISQYSCELAES